MKQVAVYIGADDASNPFMVSLMDSELGVAMTARKQHPISGALLFRPKVISNDDYRDLIIAARPSALQVGAIEDTDGLNRLDNAIYGMRRAISGFLIIPIKVGGIMEKIPTEIQGLTVHIGIDVGDAWLHLEAAHLQRKVHLMDGSPKVQVDMALYMNVCSVYDGGETRRRAALSSYYDPSKDRYQKIGPDEWGNKPDKTKAVGQAAKYSLVAIRGLWERAGFQLGMR